MTFQIPVCIYCGSRPGNDPAYASLAKLMGETLARRNMRLIYGGASNGLMGITARAALAAGGTVTGVITRQLQDLELGLSEVSLRYTEDTMHLRKQRMFELASAFIALPGGSGTLDEIAEILAWHQLGLHAKPCVLLSPDGYWAPMQAMLEQMCAKGFLPEAERDYFHLAAGPDAALDYIERMIDGGRR